MTRRSTRTTRTGAPGQAVRPVGAPAGGQPIYRCPSACWCRLVHPASVPRRFLSGCLRQKQGSLDCEERHDHGHPNYPPNRLQTSPYAASLSSLTSAAFGGRGPRRGSQVPSRPCVPIASLRMRRPRWDEETAKALLHRWGWKELHQHEQHEPQSPTPTVRATASSIRRPGIIFQKHRSLPPTLAGNSGVDFIGGEGRPRPQPENVGRRCTHCFVRLRVVAQIAAHGIPRHDGHTRRRTPPRAFHTSPRTSEPSICPIASATLLEPLSRRRPANPCGRHEGYGSLVNINKAVDPRNNGTLHPGLLAILVQRRRPTSG